MRTQNRSRRHSRLLVTVLAVVAVALAACSSGTSTATKTQNPKHHHHHHHRHHRRRHHHHHGGSTTPTSTPTSGSTPSAQPGPAPTTSITFHVSGNQVLESTGQQFIPYGFVLWCLSDPNLSCNSGPDSDPQKIVAAADDWHANTVRLQVAWEHLFGGAGGTVDSSYLQMLDSEVSLANSHHMVAIVTLQTERYQGSLMPDSNALRFWQFMAQHYKNNQMVFFDLFNEPRLTGPASQVWPIWKNGGTTSLPSGQSVTYVGMQQLVDAIRAQGAQNIIVAEGTEKDQSLAGLPAYALTGTNITYGTEPSLRPRGQVRDANPVQWQKNWGSASRQFPVMMEAFIDTPGTDACNPASPTLVPQLLDYLQQNHLGLIYFTMQPGMAVVGNNLAQPTSFSGATSFDCTANPATSAQGPGQDILNWFEANSQPIG